MPVIKPKFRPGIVKDESALAAEGGWIDADKVRFEGVDPTTIGGWETFVPGYQGICRGVFAYRDDTGNLHLGIGTHTHLYVYSGGALIDITPIESTPALTNPFTTTASSTTVTVAHNAHGRLVGSRIIVSGGTAVGGITIAGEYTVTSVALNTFTIEHGTAASSNATGGGTPTVQYLLNPGQIDGTGGSGYGTGAYGIGGYGQASSAEFFPRTWLMDNWGRQLIACPRGGGLYRWDPTTPNTRATLVPNAPTRINGFFIAPERIVVTWGVEGFADDWSPLRVRWCHQGNIEQWTPTAQNQAGEFDLGKGSMVIAGVAGRGEHYILTTSALYRMPYRTDRLVYSFPLVAEIGCIGVKAAAMAAGRLFWLAPDGQFYAYAGGAPQPLPAGIQRDMFDNIAPSQQDKIFAVPNGAFGEVWWFYPDARDGVEISRYVAFNYDGGFWQTGTFDRTAGVDRGAVGYPLLAGGSTVFLHERGNTADGQPLSCFVRSAAFDIGEGETIAFLTRIRPDFHQLIGGVNFRVYTRMHQNAPWRLKGPYPVTGNTAKVDLRASGREMQVEIASNGAPTRWRLGAMRLTLDNTPAIR